MSFFSGPFKGRSNEQVLRAQFDDGLKAREARKEGRRDRDAEAREEAASKEMRSRYREENANPEAALAVSRWAASADPAEPVAHGGRPRPGRPPWRSDAAPSPPSTSTRVRSSCSASSAGRCLQCS